MSNLTVEVVGIDTVEPHPDNARVVDTVENAARDLAASYAITMEEAQAALRRALTANTLADLPRHLKLRQIDEKA